MKTILLILIPVTALLGTEPGKDYFPITAEDWAYMGKYHAEFDSSQKTRAMLQAIAMKLGVENEVLAVSNNGGRFWEGCWKSWGNNYKENAAVFDIIMAELSSPQTVQTIKNRRVRPVW